MLCILTTASTGSGLITSWIYLDFHRIVNPYILTQLCLLTQRFCVLCNSRESSLSLPGCSCLIYIWWFAPSKWSRYFITAALVIVLL